MTNIVEQLSYYSYNKNGWLSENKFFNLTCIFEKKSILSIWQLLIQYIDKFQLLLSISSPV
jgi:hypothetical protein